MTHSWHFKAHTTGVAPRVHDGVAVQRAFLLPFHEKGPKVPEDGPSVL